MLMIEKSQRRTSGNKNANGRPQTSEVLQDEIVRLYLADVLTCKQIATAVGVSEATVYRVINRRTKKEA